jgi:hypothetical protein
MWVFGLTHGTPSVQTDEDARKEHKLREAIDTIERSDQQLREVEHGDRLRLIELHRDLLRRASDAESRR